MYNRLYHGRCMIRMRIETEQKSISINQNQYCKYMRIKQLAEQDNNKQIQVMRHMHKYHHKLREIKKTEMNYKANIVEQI